MNEQHKKDMHYVSQFYLKQFYDSDDYLHVLNLQYLNIKPFKAGGILYEEYFYSLQKGVRDEFGQELENAFTKFENSAKETIEKFIEDIKDNKQISENDKHKMSEVAAVFYVRTKSFRDDDIDVRTNIIDSIQGKMGESDQDRIFFGDTDKIGKSKQDLEKSKIKLHEENSAHIKVMVDWIPKYTNVFFKKNWKVYVATDLNRFITSDNPVMDISTGSNHPLGDNILFRKQYFVVSPEILITTELKEVQNKRVVRERITGDDINRLNARITDNAYKQIISSSTDFLELVKQMSAQAKSSSVNSNTQR